MSADESIDTVLRELGAFVTEEVAATHVAIGCLRTVAFYVRRELEGSDDAEGARLLGADVPHGGWVMSLRGLSGADVLVRDVAEGGSIHQRLTQQLIVTLFTSWDAEFQRRIAAVHRVPTREVKVDFFGDLRLLRNDIVHHRGIATAEHAGRCRTIIDQPILAGESIFLRDHDLRQINLLVPWAELERKPKSTEG